MLPDRVSNPGPLTYESGVLPIALRGPAFLTCATVHSRCQTVITRTQQNYLRIFVAQPAEKKCKGFLALSTSCHSVTMPISAMHLTGRCRCNWNVKY